MGSCCSNKAPAEEPSFSDKITQYLPLIVIVLLSVASAAALAVNGVSFMNASMAFFLLFLSALKFFNLSGFAATFSKYDILAKRIPVYANAYPFIELGLSLAYFAGIYLLATNIIMIVIMLVGSIGVIQVIRTKIQVRCACVGGGFDLPVGRVTLAENLIMALMATMNLFIH